MLISWVKRYISRTQLNLNISLAIPMNSITTARKFAPFITKEIEETLLLAAARPSELPPRQFSALRERIMMRLATPHPLLPMLIAGNKN
jgi:hypothetical protein